MSGIYIKHAADYIREFEPYYIETQAVQIFRTGGMETAIFRMQKGITGCFQAVPGQDEAEIYFVRKGKIRLIPLDDAPQVIDKDGFFSFHARQDGTLFYVMQDVELVCVANTMHYESNQGISKNVESLLRELQQRDGYSRSHGERVRRLVMKMISHMKSFDGSKLEILLQASRIHDVGKTRIPLSILIKPDALTPEETAIMRQHPHFSAEITKDLFNGEMSDILLHQHENYDGTGYPDGLAGEDIPLCSRLIAVADAYDAMIITQPYHKGIPKAEAVAELKENAGKQFDPVCVQAFCASIEDPDFESEDDIILKKAETTVELFQKELIKRDFLSNMSHDMRTPMNAIINLTELAREDADCREKLLDDLDKIDISSKFLLALVNDILDMARIESGKIELRPTVCRPKELCSYIESIIVPLCREKNINFLWDESVFPVPLYTDKVRFDQIFFNLLSNAVKYSEHGATVALYTQNTETTPTSYTTDFVVEDHGIGMSAAFQKKLFTPFERADSADSRMGTGLGLAITKSIVTQMGGTITVESALGKGTKITVHLTLPIPTEQQLAEAKIIKREKKKSAEYYEIKGKRIILAEDHPLNRDIAVRLLQKVGAIVAVAENGKAALELFQNAPEGTYSAILMDVRMPVMDGITATREIRRLEKSRGAKRIPIIAMTAEAFDECRRETIGAGMNAHLAKPIDPNLLFQTLATEIADKK